MRNASSTMGSNTTGILEQYYKSSSKVPGCAEAFEHNECGYKSREPVYPSVTLDKSRRFFAVLE